MFEGPRLGIGIWYARLRYRRTREPVIRFTDAVSHANRALVLLPEATADPSAVDEVFHFLREKFRRNKVTLIARKELRSSFPDVRGFEMLSYATEELNAWYIPRSELLRKMKKSTFDVAFDLNIGFTLPSAFLCRASQAPVRISFTKPYADDFYNFQIQTQNNGNLNQAYSHLLRCVEMF